jgi:hypothetical protein
MTDRTTAEERDAEERDAEAAAEVAAEVARNEIRAKARKENLATEFALEDALRLARRLRAKIPTAVYVAREDAFEIERDSLDVSPMFAAAATRIREVSAELIDALTLVEGTFRRQVAEVDAAAEAEYGPLPR